MKKILLVLFVLMAGAAYAEQAVLTDSCADIENAKLVHSFPLVKGNKNNQLAHVDGGTYKADGYSVQNYAYYSRIRIMWSELQDLKKSGDMDKMLASGEILDGNPTRINRQNFKVDGVKLINVDSRFPGTKFNIALNKDGELIIANGESISTFNSCRIIGVNSGGSVLHLGFQVNEKTADIYEFR